MQQMNILFLIRCLNVGGAERQLVTLANLLALEGHNVAIAIYYSNGVLESKLEKVSLIHLRKKGRYHLIGFLKSLFKEVRRFQPDLINSYMPESNLVAVLLKKYVKCPVVWGIRASDMNSGEYGLVSKVVLKAESAMSRFADHIIVNSRAGAHVCRKRGFPEKKLSVIHNGIDTSLFYPTSAKLENSFRKSLGVQEDKILVGVVARLDPMKDHLNFFQAVKEVLLSDKNVFFVCVGSGPEDYEELLAQKLQELDIKDHVILVEQRSDMNNVYNALDILCSCSKYGEGFSNVIGEAMACGVPCVVTDVGDSRMIVGSTGLVVVPDNSKQLAESIIEMTRKVRDGGCDSCLIRTRVKENFSVDVLLAKTVNLYRLLV